MGKWQIRRYDPSFSDQWNEMVAVSRNGTFLFNRGFMDYHADRFRDCSLVALREDRPTALLPANVTNDGILHSHSGLTYGGWITPCRHFDGSDMLDLFESWIAWGRAEGIREYDYKPVPSIYWRIPAAEDEYALWRFGARQTSVNLSSAFEISERPPFEKRQKRNLKKAEKIPGLRVSNTTDAGRFIDFVNRCLDERHNARAVHTGNELSRLMETFPTNITLWVAETTFEKEMRDVRSALSQTEWLAGVCIFNTGRVAHAQYIATSAEGRWNGSLAFLFDHIISRFANSFEINRTPLVNSGPKWFDFGTSNDADGLILNSSLLLQKTELGGRGITYPGYSLVL